MFNTHTVLNNIAGICSNCRKWLNTLLQAKEGGQNEEREVENAESTEEKEDVDVQGLETLNIVSLTNYYRFITNRFCCL